MAAQTRSDTRESMNLAVPNGLITSNTILYCTHWEKAVRFYREGLQLKVLFANDWFVEFGLSADSRLSLADDRRTSIKSSGGAGITLSLQVRRIETVWEYMRDNGLAPTPIKNHPWNARVFNLSDPEGHRIEIWQAAAA